MYLYNGRTDFPRKGQNPDIPAFLLFPQCFQKFLFCFVLFLALFKAGVAGRRVKEIHKERWCTRLKRFYIWLIPLNR